MSKQLKLKQERIVEAVRHGLEGDGAVEFVQNSGFAANSKSIALHLRKMGGRGRVLALINEGKSNHEILTLCFPEDDYSDLPRTAPSQGELFGESPMARDGAVTPLQPSNLYETRKMSIKVPADVYEALRLAARAEGKSQNELIVDILESALSRLPDDLSD